MSPHAQAATQANERSRHLVNMLRDSRSTIGLAPFSIESVESVVEAIEALIDARLRERDEAWVQMLLEEAAKLNGAS